MTEKLKQTTKEELAKLPKDAQEAINTLDWVSIAEEIGKKYLLSESEINDLQSITLTVLTGLTDLDLYAISIEDEIGMTKDNADKIATEAYEKIFTPISNILEENIKKNLKNKNPKPEQTLNFILSGGDYSAFIAPTPERVEVSTFAINPTPPTLADIKANIHPSSRAELTTGQEKQIYE